LQLNASENVNTLPTIQEQLQGFFSLASEFVARGGDHQYNLYYTMFMSNIKRGIKIRKRNSERPISFERLPLMMVYMPISLGGVGVLPYSLLGASKDAMMYIDYTPFERERVNQIAFILSNVGGTSLDSISEGVMKDETFSKGLRFTSERLLGDRIKRSRNAQVKLREFGIDIGKFAYELSPKRYVKAAIEDNPRLAGIIEEDKADKASSVISMKKKLIKMRVEHYERVINVENERVAREVCTNHMSDMVVMYCDHDLWYRDKDADLSEVRALAVNVINDSRKIPVYVSSTELSK
jgi:hypothetical protein